MESATSQDLFEFLDATDTPEGVHREGYAITTMEEATWAARQLSRAQSEIERVKSIARTERGRIDEWEASAIGPHLSTFEFMSGLLTFFHETERRADEKVKSIKLPYGVTCKSRQSSATIEVSDVEAFAAYADQNAPDLVKVTYAPKLAEIRSALKIAGTTVIDEDGDQVPGLVIKPERVAFSVAIDG